MKLGIIMAGGSQNSNGYASSSSAFSSSSDIGIKFSSLRKATVKDTISILNELQTRAVDPTTKCELIADFIGDFARGTYMHDGTEVPIDMPQDVISGKIITLLTHPYLATKLSLDKAARKYQGNRREDTQKATDTIFSLLLKHYPNTLKYPLESTQKKYPQKTLTSFLWQVTKQYCSTPNQDLVSLAEGLIKLGADGKAKPSMFEPIIFAFLTEQTKTGHLKIGDPLYAIFVDKYVAVNPTMQITSAPAQTPISDTLTLATAASSVDMGNQENQAPADTAAHHKDTKVIPPPTLHTRPPLASPIISFFNRAQIKTKKSIASPTAAARSASPMPQSAVVPPAKRLKLEASSHTDNVQQRLDQAIAERDQALTELAAAREHESELMAANQALQTQLHNTQDLLQEILNRHQTPPPPSVHVSVTLSPPGRSPGYVAALARTNGGSPSKGSSSRSLC